jgi:hypothetical protein
MSQTSKLHLAALLAGVAALSAACKSAEDPWTARVKDYPDTARHYLEAGLEHESLVRVKPWERDVLSRSDMAWEGDKLYAGRRAHIFFSKEGSLVGGGAGGGGCGCN